MLSGGKNGIVFFFDANTLPAVDFEIKFVAFLLGDHALSEEVIIAVVKLDLLRDIDFLLCHGHSVCFSQKVQKSQETLSWGRCEKTMS